MNEGVRFVEVDTNGHGVLRLGQDVYFFGGDRPLPGIVVELTEAYAIIGIFGTVYFTDAITDANVRGSCRELTKYGQWCFR